MNNISNKIRKISVGLDLNNQMNYFLGSKHTFYVDGQKIVKEVQNILEKENHYLIYVLGENNEIQLWKQLPKNNLTTVEFVID